MFPDHKRAGAPALGFSDAGEVNRAGASTFSQRIAMVVDDDPIVRDILRVGLARLNQDVFLAANGREALTYAQGITVSMVVLDLNMPVLNGLNTCLHLRRLPGFVATPIIILTGHDDPAAREAARRVGATEFIGKPFQPIQLMAILSHFLVLKSQQARAVHRDAQRATVIDRLPPTGPGVWEGTRETPVTTDNPFDPLDRGRRLLGALRF